MKYDNIISYIAILITRAQMATTVAIPTTTTTTPLVVIPATTTTTPLVVMDVSNDKKETSVASTSASTNAMDVMPALEPIPISSSVVSLSSPLAFLPVLPSVSSSSLPRQTSPVNVDGAVQGTKRKRDDRVQDKARLDDEANSKEKNTVPPIIKPTPVQETNAKRVKASGKEAKIHKRHKKAASAKFADEDQEATLEIPSSKARSRKIVIDDESDTSVASNEHDDDEDDNDEETTESDSGSNEDDSEPVAKRKKTQVWTDKETRLFSRLFTEIELDPRRKTSKKWKEIENLWKAYVDDENIHPRTNRHFKIRTKSKNQQASFAKRLCKVQSQLIVSRQQGVSKPADSRSHSVKSEHEKKTQDKDADKMVAKRTVDAEKQERRDKKKDRVDEKSLEQASASAPPRSKSPDTLFRESKSIYQNTQVKQAMDNMSTFCKLYNTGQDEKFLAARATEYIQGLCKYMSTEQKVCSGHVVELLKHIKSVFNKQFDELSIQIIGPYAKILRQHKWQPVDAAYEGKMIADIICLLPRIPKLFNLDLCNAWFHCVRQSTQLGSAHAWFLRNEVQCRLSATDYEPVFNQYSRLVLHDYALELTKRHVNIKTMTPEAMNALSQFVQSAQASLSKGDFETLRDKNKQFIYDMIKKCV